MCLKVLCSLIRGLTRSVETPSLCLMSGRKERQYIREAVYDARNLRTRKYTDVREEYTSWAAARQAYTRTAANFT